MRALVLASSLACLALSPANTFAQTRAASAPASQNTGDFDPSNSVRIQVRGLANQIGFVGHEFRFEVEAVDPQGDRVSLELLNPPAGLIFHPLRNEASPASSVVRWTPDASASGAHDLVFVARDDRENPAFRRRVLRLRVIGAPQQEGVVRNDINRDGHVDLIAVATGADGEGPQERDLGAIYVWMGPIDDEAPGTPSATLRIPEALEFDRLGRTPRGIELQIREVTGDRLRDIIATASYADIGGLEDVGAVYVWAGAEELSGELAPTATLIPSNADDDLLLGNSLSAGTLVRDVTGDGIQDFVVSTITASLNNVEGTGAIYLFEGSKDLQGNRLPTATLRLPMLIPGDQLGNSGGQGVQLADVTGDGILDIVAGASGKNVGSTADAGAIYIWVGGDHFSGNVNPTATLQVPDARAFDRLGDIQSGQGILLADVSGDGILDIVAGASSANAEVSLDVGAAYVWRGGPDLGGVMAPTASLTVPYARPLAEMCHLPGGQGLLIADLNDDQVLDVIAAAPAASRPGILYVGEIYVWFGGAALEGDPDPSATLRNPAPLTADLMGFTEGQGVLIRDVTGDGALDVVAGATYGEAPDVGRNGVVFLFEGGSDLEGATGPFATLYADNLVGDRLCEVPDGRGLQVADVTGDGRVDILAGSSFENVGGTIDAGAIYMWEGSSLSGFVPHTARLTVPGAAADDLLGNLRIVDLSGDGILDILAPTPTADVEGAEDAGAMYFWPGGAGLAGEVAPHATLAVPNAGEDDQLGVNDAGQDLLFADIDRDGTLDVLASTSSADLGTEANAGAVFAWLGGPALAGQPAPQTFTFTTPAAGNRLGNTSFFVDELTGDGFPDLVAGSSLRTFGIAPNVGVFLVWPGGRTGLSPRTFLHVPEGRANDRLGE